MLNVIFSFQFFFFIIVLCKLNCCIFCPQEIELKKTADKILSEVRKKTQDVTRATDLLKNLKKLRKLRKDRLLQQGQYFLLSLSQV